MPHPAAQILVWLSLAFLAQRLLPLYLSLFSLLLLAIAMRLCARQLLKLLKRTRWIMLSLLLIYAYSTPGAALIATWGVYAPTREGLLEGALQLGRLLAMLSGLAILLSLLNREQFIGGIYVLAYPLRWIGISRERAAVRLALTLQYAEPTMGDTAADWRGAIRHALARPVTQAGQIELQRPAWQNIDVVCLLFSLAIILLGVR
ncbi:MAG: CbiQ family ECF transporter T component [Aequorivita sp.]|nr:CbiQ family ECF transporter T component [Aequorivita sp.]